ncbi:glycoside hydrolase family 3 N-terminal domain-containing protein [Salinimonas chungwhensis]|uniref:glycoside hydrolase family 3 N-terminal domain-containing protein n=1 Tax=Salinimonas chungwhensis TaxID=265425 RepID=UPI000372B066|nr:glycoside hydrolase family 3 N-terminal domain-containing protein [Salinimonas chungwhensis]
MRTVAFLFSAFLSCCCLAQSALSDEPETWLGQKLMLDFRYFCEDSTASAECRTPMTHLPDAVKSLLITGRIGGVILFAQNIENTRQLVNLNYELQTLMAAHNLPPLFIAIDQEGGRVARIPDDMATRFVGNMAIGAAGQPADEQFAQQVASGLASSMKQLGFNVNFAPSVDVNVNPANPVINVRSYGESPEHVARLGAITVEALQSHNVLSAIKHFPGHGDTHVDSHTGLPLVTHNKSRIEAVDLQPFKHIINSGTSAAMIMTAHIQYPALDDTRIQTRNGNKQVIPATLSKKILTGLLREEMGYTGLIVTDAMDMAGIAHYFTPAQALQRTFEAGADIALMPFVIRNKSDIAKFHTLRKALLRKITSNAQELGAMQASALRIARTKTKFDVGSYIKAPLSQRLQTASKLPDTASLETEQALADAAITLLRGQGNLPLSQSGRWRIVMPDAARCRAIVSAISNLNKTLTVACRALLDTPATLPWQTWYPDDVLIVGDITPQHTVAEMGGLDDPRALNRRTALPRRHNFLKTLMKTAETGNATTVFVAMRAPYNVADFYPFSDVQLATFGYNVEVTEAGEARGAVFTSLAKTLLGIHTPMGRSPVTIDIPADH